MEALGCSANIAAADSGRSSNFLQKSFGQVESRTTRKRFLRTTLGRSNEEKHHQIAQLVESSVRSVFWLYDSKRTESAFELVALLDCTREPRNKMMNKQVWNLGPSSATYVNACFSMFFKNFSKIIVNWVNLVKNVINALPMIELIDDVDNRSRMLLEGFVSSKTIQVLVWDILTNLILSAITIIEAASERTPCTSTTGLYALLREITRKRVQNCFMEIILIFIFVWNSWQQKSDVFLIEFAF